MLNVRSSGDKNGVIFKWDLFVLGGSNLMLKCRVNLKGFPLVHDLWVGNSS